MTSTDVTPDTTSGDVGPTPHWTGVDPASTWVPAARRLAAELAPGIDEHDRHGTFVAHGFQALRDGGFPAMLVPEELGGGGAGYAETCAAIAELARGCPSTALAFSMHTHLVAAQVWRHRRGLPAPVLARVADEGLVLISTGAADWIDSGGSARPVDGGWRVSARKAPASGCPAGDVLVTSACWDDAPDGPQVLHCSVPFGAAGLSIEPTWDTLGMRGTGSETVVLDDVFVPESAVALTRPAGRWHPVWATVVGAALPLIMSAYVGVAEEAMERAVKLAAGRADRPETASLIGEMGNRLTSARDTVRAMIEAADELCFDNTLEAAVAALSRKTNAAEACIETVRLALETGGGAAYGRAAGVEILFRDVHGSLYHPLPSRQQHRFTGRIALGLDPLDRP